VVQAAAVALIGALSACGLSNGTEEYVVHFAPGTPTAPARAVGEACPKFGKAFLEPKDKNNLATSRAYPVRYDITNATSADKNALLSCLKKHSIVRGVSDTNDDS
jgi:hypothetical protein